MFNLIIQALEKILTWPLKKEQIVKKLIFQLFQHKQTKDALLLLDLHKRISIKFSANANLNLSQKLLVSLTLFVGVEGACSERKCWASERMAFYNLYGLCEAPGLLNEFGDGKFNNISSATDVLQFMRQRGHKYHGI